MRLSLPDRAIEALLRYRDLIVKWNRVYNLTAVNDPDEMLARHLLDSLSIAPLITTSPVLDVGSGAGLPGIPLAIALPDVQFVLLDTAAKRTRFMSQAVAELGLANVEVVTARIQGFRPAQRFGVITSRAFTALSEFLQVVAPLLADDGRVIAMTGQHKETELDGVGQAWTSRVVALDYPGRNGERHAVILSRPAL